MECLYFGFQRDVGRTPMHVTASDGWLLTTMRVFKVHWSEGDAISDLSAVLISPVRDCAPLPHAEIADRLPVTWQQVFFLGHHRPEGAPKDSVGHAAGMAVWYKAARVIYVGRDFFLIDTPVKKGMSGGPVVDPSSGAIVGIISERWPEKLTMR